MVSGPFTLAELAHAAGLSIEDVRFYGDCGLLQAPRRKRSVSGDVAFFSDHVERLHFIQRSLAYGFTHDDIAALVDSNALVTCGDVYAIARRRLEHLRAAGREGTPEVVRLAQLLETCRGVGSRYDCNLLEALSSVAPPPGGPKSPQSVP